MVGGTNLAIQNVYHPGGPHLNFLYSFATKLENLEMPQPHEKWQPLPPCISYINSNMVNL
jgi:hypothetical protein